MGVTTYLTTVSAQFGTLAWLFFIGQILGVAAGAYLLYVHTERNLARKQFARQLGIALMVVAGVGVVIGILRMLNVPFLNQRLWFWIQFVVELLLAGYVAFYVRSVLPRLEREQAGQRSARTGGTRQVAASGEAAPATPRPIATTTRRDSRRDRKRKNK